MEENKESLYSKGRKYFRESVWPHLTPLVVLNILILLTIIVSGAALFMALVGMLHFSSSESLALFVEINSQILNALFTYNAFVSHPGYTIAVWHTWKYWKATKSQDKAIIHSSAVSINKIFNAIRLQGFQEDSGRQTSPNTLIDSPSLSNDALEARQQSMDANRITVIAENLAQQSNNSVSSDVVVSNLENRCIGDAQNIQKDPSAAASQPLTPTPFASWIRVILFLQLQCIFQYPITFAMWYWAQNFTQRPSLIISICLPLSFLSGLTGGLSLLQIDRKASKQQKEATHTDIPLTS